MRCGKKSLTPAKVSTVKSPINARLRQAHRRSRPPPKTLTHKPYRRIDAATYLPFLDEHHLQGGRKAKFAYGLFFRARGRHGQALATCVTEDLVAVATFAGGRNVVRGGVRYAERALVHSKEPS